MKNKIFKSIPNIITCSRIITCILAAICFTMGNMLPSIILYCYSAVSDFLDGMLARKLHAYSEFGRKLDAVSDKIFIGAAILPAIALGNYLMLAPLLLESCILTITACKHINRINPRTERIGKFKSCFLFPTVILGLVGAKVSIINLLMSPLLCISTILQINSMQAYFNQKYIEKDDIKKESLLGLNGSINCNKRDVEKDSLKKIKQQYLCLRNELIDYLNGININSSECYLDNGIINKVRERKR